MYEGSTPAEAVATTLTIGVNPSRSAFFRDIITTIAAPSQTGEDVAAVTGPFVRKIVGSFVNF
jgi:hypothetical protein